MLLNNRSLKARRSLTRKSKTRELENGGKNFRRLKRLTTWKNKHEFEYDLKLLI